MENLKINCEVELTELERVKKELEETKKKYSDLSDLIFNCSIDIDKAATLLNYWTQEYGFSQKPDPRAANRWGSQVPNRNTDPEKEKAQGFNSFKWFYEYDMIYNFIDIVSDYVYKTQQALERGLK